MGYDVISYKPDHATRERYVANILSVYRQANPSQRQRGREWYRTAHQLADMMAEGDIVKGAGVIAALSANKSWQENIKLATNAFRSGTPSKHFKDAIRKATMIMNGANPSDVLPMSAKTGQFYRCIVDPDDPDAVVIDRHAHDAAVGTAYGNRERGLDAKGRYAVLAHAYREAAAWHGILPNVMQATVWLVWIENGKGK